MTKAEGLTTLSTSQETGRVQTFLDSWHDLRSVAIHRLVYFSMRLFGLEVSLTDITRGSYEGSTHGDLSLEHAQDTQALLLSSKECLNDARARRESIADKCKTLLAMSSILLALIGFLLPDAFAFDSYWMRALCLLPLLGLLNVMVLLLSFFAVGNDSRLTLDQAEVELDTLNFSKNRINLYLQCQVDSDNRTDYLVDLYKVARFFFLLSLSIAFVLFAASFLMSSEGENEEFIEQLKRDPGLVEMLRGPEGEKGDKGDAGQQGPVGDKGQDATFDVDAIVDRLINDPRLKRAIDANAGAGN